MRETGRLLEKAESYQAVRCKSEPCWKDKERSGRNILDLTGSQKKDS